MNSEGFEYINEEDKITPVKEEKEETVKEEQELNNLPDWDLEPPYTVVRRRIS